MRLSPRQAIERLVPPGSVVGIGGMHMTAAPMSLARELIRHQVPVRRLVTSPSASIQADLLIAAGLVTEIISPYVGFEDLGLAPAFRRAVEMARLGVLECDEGSLTHALYAGAGGIPFFPCPPGIDLTDIPRVDPELFREVTDPFTGERRWAVRAIRPDVTLLACRQAAPDGTVWFGRQPFTDRLLALAAHRLVVQVERLVPAGSMAGLAPGETLPGFLVDAVVVVPGGCHPTASPGEYGRDAEAIRGYLEAARDPDELAGYLGEAGIGADEDRYLARAAAVSAGGRT
jgi:glutaconate CoA-transferase, subunit A